MRRVSTPHAATFHTRRPRINPWLVAVAALAAALVGLGVWVLVDRQTKTTEALASPAVVAMLVNRIAAWDRADGKAVAAFYTRDAVMEERDVTPAFVSRGRQAIGDRLQTIIDLGLRMRPVGTPVQMGRFVGEPVRFYAVEGESTAWRAVGEAVLVFEIAANGRIAHQWVMGEVRG